MRESFTFYSFIKASKKEGVLSHLPSFSDGVQIIKDFSAFCSSPSELPVPVSALSGVLRDLVPEI